MTTRIASHIIPKTYIVFDTSVLFPKDIKFIVTEKFDVLANEAEKKYNIKYCLPEVVKDELIYRHKQKTLSILRGGIEALDNIGELFNKRKKAPYSEKEINILVLKRFDRWIKNHKINVLKTPFDKINLKELIHDSVNKIPPFESYKNRGEKGFKDSIIMHTILNMPDKYEKGKIVFVCNDNVLHDATLEKFRPKDRFKTFKSIDELSSYLRLQAEKLSENWIKSITERAKLIFFDPSNNSGLLYSERITEKIKDKYRDAFKQPTSHLGLLGERSYEELDSGDFWLAPPVFQSIQKNNIYIWKTTMYHKQRYRQKYRAETVPAVSRPTILTATGSIIDEGLSTSHVMPLSAQAQAESWVGTYGNIPIHNALSLPQPAITNIDRTYTLTFDVYWSSKIDKRSRRFSDVKVLEIKFVSGDFE